jgi:alpha-tubulin suppressor-like RCC1 family protein
MPANVTLTVISTGNDYSLALDTAGQAWAWGYGPLGSNSMSQSLVPVAAEMPANVTFTTISAGYGHSLALDTAGHAWAWGNNGHGQLGNNSTDKSLAPVAVQMPMNVTYSTISAGSEAGYGFSLALDTAGQAWAWGYNPDGELGNNSTDQSLVPVAVQMPTSVTFSTISAGAYGGLALQPVSGQ